MSDSSSAREKQFWDPLVRTVVDIIRDFDDPVAEIEVLLDIANPQLVIYCADWLSFDYQLGIKKGIHFAYIDGIFVPVVKKFKDKTTQTESIELCETSV